MEKDMYRIECIDGQWTVRDKTGWNTYYFGESYQDCEQWIFDNNGAISEW